MSDWVCPNCDGGFPEPAETRTAFGQKAEACPWCDQILGEYDSSSKVKFIMDEPCDWFDGGEQCEQMPTAYAGDIYYACEEHYEDCKEWVKGGVSDA